MPGQTGTGAFDEKQTHDPERRDQDNVGSEAGQLGKRFGLVFAALLVLLLVVVLARFGFWAALEFPYVLGDQLGFFLFLAIPLFWVLPAYVSSLIRPRVAILIGAIGLIAALTTWGVSIHH